MQPNYSVYETPSFAPTESYSFEASEAELLVYNELNKINEEIEKCRERNC